MINKFNKSSGSFEIKLNQLNRTFDIFIKSRVQRELSMLKPEMRKIKEVIKEKLGVDIDTKS